MDLVKKNRVFVWDQMVLVGLAMAFFYVVFDSVLYIFLEFDVDFFQRLLGPDISQLWSRLTILCLFAIFGAHAQYTINQRKVVENALRESEERYRRIIETTPDGYYEIDLNGRYTYFNDSMCDITGYSKEEMANMSFTAQLDRANATKVSKAFKKIYRTGQSTKALDWKLVSRNGSEKYVESSIYLQRDSKGVATGYGGFLRDVTERQRAQALRQAKIAAEAANRSKSRFLANMSHEIRTPLNSIIGLIELMLDSDLRPDQREDLGVVLASAYALLSLINNVLDFSKIEAGKFKLENVPFSLRDFMGETLKMMALRTQTKGLELTYSVAGDVPDRLVGDPGRLRQVLLNLIENAVKFTQEGEIKVKVSYKGQSISEIYLQMSVEDTGIGIPKEKQKIIFSPFRQIETASAVQTGGTGLGLAVSAQLIKLMGGRIKVESEPTQGSKFRFGVRFPRLDAAPEAHKESSPDILSGLKVLVVDDNTTHRRLVHEMLQRAGAACQSVAGAQEVREILANTGSRFDAYDLILIDSDMPQSDGFELARWIQSRTEIEARVIMMLTFPHLKRKAELPQLGIMSSILKPFRPSELWSVIRKALDLQKPEIRPIPETAPPKRRAWPPALKILVAEDTPFNQTFILRLLEKHGFVTILAENGKQVLQVLKQQDVDLILMDVNMPEMDGFEATRCIRESEKEKGTHLPIIAMTAYAIAGDRERCLQAGMDDYVSKPISAEKLFQTIAKYAPSLSAAAEERIGMNNQHLLEAFENDTDLFKELVDIFCSDYPKMLSSMRKALSTGDLEGLSRAAHSLKGMLRNFQADAAAQVALELERNSKEGRSGELATSIDKLETQIFRIEKTLRNMVATLTG